MFSDCSLITFLGFCSQMCQYISSTNPTNPFPTWFNLRFFFFFLQQNLSQPCLYCSLFRGARGRGMHPAQQSNPFDWFRSWPRVGEEVLWSWPHLATWLVQLDKDWLRRYTGSWRPRISKDSFTHLNQSFHLQILFHQGSFYSSLSFLFFLYLFFLNFLLYWLSSSLPLSQI